MEGERRDANPTMSITSVGDMLHAFRLMRRIITNDMSMFHVAKISFLGGMMATLVHMKPVMR
eukprot:4538567-Karenia_brevis.AAC.1